LNKPLLLQFLAGMRFTSVKQNTVMANTRKTFTCSTYTGKKYMELSVCWYKLYSFILERDNLFMWSCFQNFSWCRIQRCI